MQPQSEPILRSALPKAVFSAGALDIYFFYFMGLFCLDLVGLWVLGKNDPVLVQCSAISG